LEVSSFCELHVFYSKVNNWGWGQGGELNQALYAHMNNKRKMKKKIIGRQKFFSRGKVVKNWQFAEREN
jgi:hypothetical protein